jgi:hypothetical protein
VSPADAGGGRKVQAKLTLHLGVVVQPYRNGGLTTGDVAEILEAKYGVMEAFYKAHGQDIADALTDSLKGALESLMMGQRTDPFGTAMGDIKREFSHFILSKEGVEHVGIPGVPTAAALAGVSHRLRHPYAKSNPRRPSFRDTGLYESSFLAWAD